MDKRLIRAASIFVASLLAFLGVLFAVLYATGLLNRHKNVRVGYVEMKSPTQWEANYVSIDGTMSGEINVKDEFIDVEITTNSGIINIEMINEDGEVVYRGNDLQSCYFVVGTNGKTKIIITADNHSGSFSFK